MEKTIVLTGVSRGLGRALLDEFIAAGHTIIGCARSEQQIQELKSTYSDKHRFDSVDLAYDSAVSDWAADVLSQYGAPDLLINNAATINQNAPLWEVPHHEMVNVMAINVTAVVSMIRYFVPAMIENGSGVVVNLSSGWGRSVSPDVAPYCASKWAIEGLTRALAEDLPTGLAAIPLNPGVINTDMLQSCFGAAASNHQSTESWAKRAAPLILSFGPEHNGQPLAV